MSEIVINERLSALRVSLALTQPLSFLPANGTRRDLAIISIRDREGTPYHGEIAPLAGFSVETVDDALSELDSIAFAIPPLEELTLPLPRSWAIFLHAIHCPSLRCGIEGAILDRLARTDALSPFVKNPTVACNGLIMIGDEQETVREIKRRLDRGFHTLKVKISPKTIESTLRALRALDLPSTTRLRLDANRSFSVTEWRAVATDLKGLPIEYVEEPVTKPDALPAIVAPGDLPIAIDETTRDTAPDEWLRWGLRAVVLKPSLNGGLLSLMPLISMIERYGAYVTLSSSFESGLGLRSITLLASLLERCGAIGVDTASFLGEDLTEPPFPPSTPSVATEELFSMRYIGDKG
jgi:o-succinylbenzoate synthase